MIKVVEISKNSIFYNQFNELIQGDKTFFSLEISLPKDCHNLTLSKNSRNTVISTGNSVDGLAIAKTIIQTISEKDLQKELSSADTFSLHADLLIDGSCYYLFLQAFIKEEGNYLLNFRFKPVEKISKDIIGFTKIDGFSNLRS